MIFLKEGRVIERRKTNKNTHILKRNKKTNYIMKTKNIMGRKKKN